VCFCVSTYSVLQCVAVCCSVLQKNTQTHTTHTQNRHNNMHAWRALSLTHAYKRTHARTHTHTSTRTHTYTHAYTHARTHSARTQHSYALVCTPSHPHEHARTHLDTCTQTHIHRGRMIAAIYCVSTHRNTLQRTATRCNML